jgi:hypothetical protein
MKSLHIEYFQKQLDENVGEYISHFYDNAISMTEKHRGSITLFALIGIVYTATIYGSMVLCIWLIRNQVISSLTLQLYIPFIWLLLYLKYLFDLYQSLRLLHGQAPSITGFLHFPIWRVYTALIQVFLKELFKMTHYIIMSIIPVFFILWGFSILSSLISALLVAIVIVVGLFFLGGMIMSIRKKAFFRYMYFDELAMKGLFEKGKIDMAHILKESGQMFDLIYNTRFPGMIRTIPYQKYEPKNYFLNRALVGLINFQFINYLQENARMIETKTG